MKIKLIVWAVCFLVFIGAPVVVLVSANHAVVDVRTIVGDFPSLPLGGLLVGVFASGLLLGFIICLLPTALELLSLKKVKKQLNQATAELEKLRTLPV